MNNKERILHVLFKEDKPLHIRLLAKKAGVSPNTVITHAKELEKEGFIISSTDYNRTLLAPSYSGKYRRKKTTHNIEVIYDSGLINYLQEELALPTIILFGSYAKGENHPESDIDIFIIADEKKQLDLARFEKILDAEIQIFLHTKKEFGQLRKNNKELVNNILNGIVLTGFLEAI